MAAPTVGAVMADILPYLGVARDYSEEDPALRQIVLEDYSGLPAKEAQQKLASVGLTARIVGSEGNITDQIPAAGQTVPGGSEIILYLGEEAAPVTVEAPDFMGMDRQKASDAAGRLGLYILITGSTELAPEVTVTAQSVPAGTKIPMGTTITLEFKDTAAH